MAGIDKLREVLPAPLEPTPKRTFRDPDGWLELVRQGPVVRHLTPGGMRLAERLLASPCIRKLQEEGSWVQAEPAPEDTTTLLHPRVWFPSYPHEWPAIMLQRAGAHTLRIQKVLLEEGLELKDASPNNILFEGTRPVFVDFLSPVERPDGQMGWRAYGQFTRTFLIPLYLFKHRALPLSWAGLARRDGIPPEDALALLGPSAWFRPAGFFLIALPAWLGRRGKASSSGLPLSADPSLGKATTRRLLQGLGRQLDRLVRRPRRTSFWSNYQDEGISYTADALEAKAGFVAQVLARLRPERVLDLGCNTGHFSRLAATAGARVIALDSDPLCIQRVFLEAERNNQDILPLVANLGRPSPELGWDGADGLSLHARLAGQFDLVLALALIHHLLITERLPLERVLEQLATWTTRWMILEWVPPSDPQFQRLAGPNHALYDSLTPARAEAAFQLHFDVAERLEQEPGGRILYLLRRVEAQHPA